MIVDLLATAAFEKNQEVQTICCTIFKRKELVKIINNKEVKLHYKRPFMRFLISVYMDGKKKQKITKM